MRRGYYCLILSIFSYGTMAQPASLINEFEGSVTYKTEVKSKLEGISDNALKAMLATGDNIISYIKKGNYRQSANTHDLFYIHANQRAYYKFKQSDTLYYLEYNADSSAVLNVTRQKPEKQIAGYSCDAIIIQTETGFRKYYYSPRLPLNPEYDKSNTLGSYNLYLKEAASVWLGYSEETEHYSINTIASKIEQKKLDEGIFELPKLPQKKLTYDELVKPAEFRRAGGFTKYLQTALDASLGAKYLKIPKGEKEITQTIIVNFLITERGTVTNVKAENLKEVHPKLAEEAIRVISASPLWVPANVFGEKTVYRYRQPVTFMAAK